MYGASHRSYGSKRPLFTQQAGAALTRPGCPRGLPLCRHLGKPIYFLLSVSVEFLRQAKMMLQSMQGFVRPILVSDRHRLQRNVEKGRPCERSPASDPTRQHRAFMRAFVQPLDALRDEIRSRCLIKSGHSFPWTGRASAASRRLDASASVSGKSTGRGGAPE